MGLILLILLLALAGGFLGTLIEAALWVVLILVAVGGLLGLLVYRLLTRARL